MTKTRHKRTAVSSMFQNGISRNTKCVKRDGFCRAGHIYPVKTILQEVLQVLQVFFLKGLQALVLNLAHTVTYKSCTKNETFLPRYKNLARILQEKIVR